MGQGRALALVGGVTLDTNDVSATEADVSVTNSTSSSSVFAGNTIAYTVTVANAGPNAAQTVALSDAIPAGTTFVSDVQTSGPAFTLTNPAVGGTGTISGTIATLASGASATFTVVARVPASTASGASIVNTPTVSTITDDPNLANESQTVTTTVQTQADVSLTNTSAATVVAGNTVSYTITVANNGPSDAQTLALNDLLPTHTTFVSEAQTSGPAFSLTSPAVGSAGTLHGTIGTLASGVSASFTVVALVSASTASGASIVNTPSVTVATTDPTSSNNSQTATTGVLTNADLSLSNVASASTVVAGNTISYTVTVANAGPSDAQTVTLSDAIPANATFVSATQSSGPSFTPSNPAVGGTGTISDTIGSFASSASATFNVVVQVAPGTSNGASVVNTPGVSGVTTDPNLANNSHAAATSVTAAAPTVTGVSPAQGTIAGGTIVTIVGTNLESASAVDFGSTPITSFTSDSATQIVLVSPAGAGGTVDITVVTPGGTSVTSSADRFTRATAPTITSLARATFIAGLPGSFVFSTTGSPVAALTSSTLPAGLSFVDNLDGTATLSGTPSASAVGLYSLTITASNGVSPTATQVFTLTVGATIPALTALSVSAPANTLDSDRTLQFVASGTDSAGASISLGQLTWSLDAGSVGSVDQNGLFTAGSVGGIAIVRATTGGQTATESITINPVQPSMQTTHVSSVQTLGSAKAVTGFVVTFNGPVDPTTAQNVHGYRILRQSTVGNRLNFFQRVFGLGAGTQTQYVPYKIASAVYDSQTDSVTLTLVSPMPVKNGMRVLKVMGTGAHAVLDANGKAIDGEMNGTAGGNYVDRFRVSVAKRVTYRTATGATATMRLSGPGEIVTILPTDTKLPTVNLVDTDPASSILTGDIRKGRSKLAYATLDELNGSAGVDNQLGSEFHVNVNNSASAL